MSGQYQLGILFVHGMGQQQRGDTLAEQGEAVVSWLQQRVADSESTRLRIGRVRLRSQAGLAAKAEIEVAFRPRDGAATDTSPRWLLSESWWADSFRPAGFLATMMWAVSVGPWLIAAQLDGVNQRAISEGNPSPWTALLRSTTSLVLGVVAALAAALLTPFALSLAVLAIPPIPLLRDVIVAAQRNMSGSYGDLQRLVTSDVQFGAMWSQVYEDIADLTGRCERVAIVAHSQGSAVSWQAIRRLAQMPHADARRHGIHRDRIRTFVTYGQALRKLKMLYLIRTQSTFGARAVFVFWSSLSTLGLVGLAGAVFMLWSAWSGETQDTDAAFGLAGIAGVVVWLAQSRLSDLATTWSARTQAHLRGEIAGVQANLPQLRWTDYWASADPAPIGPLLTAPAPGDDKAPTPWVPAVPSYKVRNLGSTVLDHMVYWSNVSEFISGLVLDATRDVPRMPFARAKLSSQLPAAIRQRHWRVGLLVASRWIYFVTAGALFVVWFGDLIEIGSAAFNAVTELLPVDDLGSDYRWLRSGIGAALFVAGTMAGWYLVVKAWGVLMGGDTRRWFTGSAPIATSGAIAWLVVAALLVTSFLAWLAQISVGGALVYGVLLAIGGLLLGVLSRGGRTRAESVTGVAPWERRSSLTLAAPILIGGAAFAAAWIV